MESNIPPSTPLTTNYYQPDSYSNPSNSASSSDIESLRVLCNKRIATFAHLHRVLEGKSHYFNTVIILKEEVSNLYDNSKLKKRSVQYFTLGTSLGPIVDITHPIDFSKALATLLSEYDGYLNLDGGKPKRLQFFRKSRTLAPTFDDNSSLTNNSNLTGGGGGGSSLGSSGDGNEFINLGFKNIPFDLDYLQVFYALCNIICVVYHKIIDNMKVPVPPNYIETMYKADVKFKKIIGTVTKELDGIVRASIKEELGIIDPLVSMKQGYQFEDWDLNPQDH